MINTNYIIKFLSSKQEKIDILHYNDLKQFELNKDVDFNLLSTKPLINYTLKSNNIISNNNNSNNNNNNNNNNSSITRKSTKLNSTFEVIFKSKTQELNYDNYLYKNKSPIFTLLNSIFIIGDYSYNLNEYEEKDKIIRDFILKIDKELFEDDLYNKFGYNINRKFNKGNIQFALKNAYQYKICDTFNLLKQYIADYLGINIYILKVQNNNFDASNSEYYLSTKFDNNIHKILPNFIILEDDLIYKPVINSMSNIPNNILLYSKNSESIDNLWNILNIHEPIINKMETDIKETDNKEIIETTESIETIKKIQYDDIKKLKIDEIKELCIKYNIELTKLSEKTNKPINKLKAELITDLLQL